MRERRDREREVGIESLMYWSQLPFIRIEFAHAKHQLMDLRDFIRNFKWPESPSTFNNNKAFCYTGGSSPRPFRLLVSYPMDREPPALQMVS